MRSHVSVIDVVVDSKLQYFKKSLKSLVAQTVTDFELVLDDRLDQAAQAAEWSQINTARSN